MKVLLFLLKLCIYITHNKFSYNGFSLSLTNSCSLASEDDSIMLLCLSERLLSEDSFSKVRLFNCSFMKYPSAIPTRNTPKQNPKPAAVCPLL